MKNIEEKSLEENEKEIRSEKILKKVLWGIFLIGVLFSLYGFDVNYKSRKAEAELLTNYPTEYKEYLTANENYRKIRYLFNHHHGSKVYPKYKSVNDLLNEFSGIDISSVREEYRRLFLDIVENSEKSKRGIEMLQYGVEKHLEEKRAPIKDELGIAEPSTFTSYSLPIVGFMMVGVSSVFLNDLRKEKRK